MWLRISTEEPGEIRRFTVVQTDGTVLRVMISRRAKSVFILFSSFAKTPSLYHVQLCILRFLCVCMRVYIFSFLSSFVLDTSVYDYSNDPRTSWYFLAMEFTLENVAPRCYKISTIAEKNFSAFVLIHVKK